MKSIIDFNHYFKFMATILCSLTICNIVIGQNRKSLDIHRIKVTSAYVFENGKKTSNYWPIRQEIIDSLGRLHSEIEYGFQDHYPHKVIAHYFEGKVKIKTEFYMDKILKSKEEYIYNTDSLLVNKKIFKVNPGDTSLSLVLTYKYKQGMPIQVNAVTSDGKKAYTSISKFDPNGTEIKRKVKSKKGYIPEDSILKLIRIPTYDSLTRLKIEKTITTKYNKNTITKEYRYSYDKKSNCIEKLEVDEKGNQIMREERLYQSTRNRLAEVRIYDKSNTLIKDLENRYELYRTKDLRIREIEY